MNDAYDQLVSALHGIPDLPDAACRGIAALFDDIADPQWAISICNNHCPSRTRHACDQWAAQQPVNTLHGVIAGQLYEWVAWPGKRRKATTEPVPYGDEPRK